MSTQKVITVPKHTTNLIDNQGKETGVSKNTLMHFMSVVTENAPHKTETDALLAKSVREKIDAYTGGDTFEIEETEIVFLQQGIQSLRERSIIAGSSWYYLISALREAKDKPK